jgi:Zn-dependent membrane protease YugP
MNGSFIILIPMLIFAMWAQSRVSTTFNKYLKVAASRNLTGAQVARLILDQNGLNDVEVEMVRGKLSDHYDPRSRKVRLSQEVFRGDSISSVSVAAHECGHALQHSLGYTPLQIRSLLAPVAQFGSKFVWFLIMGGLVLGYLQLFDIGIMIYAVILLFQVVTLPVEFNASSRALTQMNEFGIVYGNEQELAKKVLNAAAMTYVAAVAVSLGELIRLILLRGNRD